MWPDKTENIESTDWNTYFSKKVPEETYVSRATNGLLKKFIEKHARSKIIFITELGGAGSRSYKPLRKAFSPSLYYFVDNNIIGLELIKKRIPKNQQAETSFIYADVLSQNLASFPVESDVVFSLGLIEHFSALNTRKVIEIHFKLCRIGGLVVISFPTPTFLYVILRKFAEIFKKWPFHDERPIKFKEFKSVVSQYGTILDSKIIWKIGFTQYMVIARKK